MSGNLERFLTLLLCALLAGCANSATGGVAGTEPPPAQVSSVAPPAAPPQTAATQVATAPVAAPAAGSAPAAKPDAKVKSDSKVKIKMKSKVEPTGTLKPDGTYVLSEAELALDCKKLTGRTLVRILQIRDYQLTRKGSAAARGSQQVIAPIFGGTTYGADPEADYRRDRAIVEAYNRRLAEKQCKVFDLVKELQPKPAGESPVPVKK
jgi:hypothetical protein